jgi:hypothetical protein
VTEQTELSAIMANATELHDWYVALQEAGFNEAMAYGLLTPLLMSGQIRLESDL